MTPTQVPPQPQSAPQQAPTVPLRNHQPVLAARQQLLRVHEQPKQKSEPAAATARPVNNCAGKTGFGHRSRSGAPGAIGAGKRQPKKEAYRWKATTPVMQQKSGRHAEGVKRWNMKRRNWRRSWRQKPLRRDPWAAPGESTFATKTGRTGGVKCSRRATTQYVCICAPQRHLNNRGAQQNWLKALSTLKGSTVELTIVEDDNPAVRTPLEWRQAIYEEKLAQARESRIADNNIQTLRRFFDAELDEEISAPFDRKHSLRSSSLT